MEFGSLTRVQIPLSNYFKKPPVAGFPGNMKAQHL